MCNYFATLHGTFIKLKIYNPDGTIQAERVFNYDEIPNKSFTAIRKYLMCLQGQGSAGKQKGQLHSTCNTMGAISSLAGSILFPHLFLFCPEVNSAPDVPLWAMEYAGFTRPCVTYAPNAYQHAGTFEAFIKFFHEYLLENNVATPVVLIIDNHSTHLGPGALEFALLKGIHIVKLPPNMTDIIQPNDKFNQHFHTFFARISAERRRAARAKGEQPSASQKDFYQISLECWKRCWASPATVSKGWADCGITKDGLRPEVVLANVPSMTTEDDSPFNSPRLSSPSVGSSLPPSLFTAFPFLHDFFRRMKLFVDPFGSPHVDQVLASHNTNPSTSSPPPSAFHAAPITPYSTSVTSNSVLLTPFHAVRRLAAGIASLPSMASLSSLLGPPVSPASPALPLPSTGTDVVSSSSSAPCTPPRAQLHSAAELDKLCLTPTAPHDKSPRSQAEYRTKVVMQGIRSLAHNQKILTRIVEKGKFNETVYAKSQTHLPLLQKPGRQTNDFSVGSSFVVKSMLANTPENCALARAAAEEKEKTVTAATESRGRRQTLADLLTRAGMQPRRPAFPTVAEIRAYLLKRTERSHFTLFKESDWKGLKAKELQEYTLREAGITFTSTEEEEEDFVLDEE
jgi:hypothetical protein